MGKMKGKKQPKQNNNGYFAQNALKYGDDFLKRKRSDELKRDAPKIFKDIAFAGGRVGSITKYFMNQSFVRNISFVADELYKTENASCIGLNIYYRQSIEQGTYNEDERLLDVLNKKAQQAEAYNIILTGLNNIVRELDSIKVGKDKMAVYYMVGKYLKSMSINLKNYRFVL